MIIMFVIYTRNKKNGRTKQERSVVFGASIMVVVVVVLVASDPKGELCLDQNTD